MASKAHGYWGGVFQMVKHKKEYRIVNGVKS